MSGADGARPLRIAVLWARLSGYMHASLQALVSEGVEVLVYHLDAESEAPFDSDSVTAGLEARVWDEASDPAVLQQGIEAFAPDALIINSWHRRTYRQVGRALRGRTLRILAMDNQWRATLKQWAGVLTAPWVLRPVYDAVLLPDERQAVFAARLGFPAERLIWGIYTCDHPRFSQIAEARAGELPPRAFLFAGRLVADKAIDVLAAGYRTYHDATDDPWPLLVAGTGPQASLLHGSPGVEMLGFVQPDGLPAVFARAGCLVLPSRFEPWGVVVHEATAAGLPVICTRDVGASTRLVLDGYNGVVISAGEAGALAEALTRLHVSTDDQRRAMGLASESLARQYTPRRWAQNLVGRIGELRSQIGLDSSPGRGSGPVSGPSETSSRRVVSS